MRAHPSRFAAAMLLFVLAGCNTTDALTPQADIPNASNQDQQNNAASDGQTVQNDVADNTTQPMNQVATNGRAPQNTLEAQAQALERGEENPSLTRSENTSLGANLYKSNSEAKPVSSLYAANTAKGSIRFLPIIGAPVQAVTPLSKELGNTARSNGLSIKPSSDASAEHVLKGYLSAFSDGKNVTVVYVWDILDNGGARLHRIQGQQSVPGKSSDAWASVPPELMQQIGVETIAEYIKWKDARQG
ncbi:hypothetical protein JJB09_07995 [Rhizobium sp. KVB221]|uniref:Lipoprotein n=1 Tax=Rhizobium setariae TaxID=2801340 RepID=A0A936YPB4_9HYPH|nr:hypothetical protein [Rhizobium setariae]MBL0371966.1 hypothetical protein [Rhizobium setariae]